MDSSGDDGDTDAADGSALSPHMEKDTTEEACRKATTPKIVELRQTGFDNADDVNMEEVDFIHNEDEFQQAYNSTDHEMASDEDFEMPSSRHTRKRKTSSGEHEKAVKQFHIETKNRFEALAQSSKTSDSNVAKTVEIQNGSSSTAQKPTTPRRQRVPPITVHYGGHYLSLNAALKARLDGPLKAIYRGKTIKYHFDTLKDQRTALKFFNDHQIHNYTHQPQSERQLKVVLKGLPEELTEQEVATDLIDRKLQPTDVHQYKKRDEETQELHPMGVFVVSLPKGKDSDSVYDIRYMFDTKVTVETFESKDGPPQCKRCQGFFHTANYCNMPAKCVRCGEHHQSKDCKLPKTQLPKCANCGKTGHPASFRGCEAFQKAIKAYHMQPTKKQNPTTTQKIKDTPMPTPAEAQAMGRRYGKGSRSYSDALQGGKDQPPITTTNHQEGIFAEIASFLGTIKSFFANFQWKNVLNIVMKTIHNFNNATDLISKVMTIIGGVMEFIGYHG